jgi:hypothetical protein
MDMDIRLRMARLNHDLDFDVVGVRSINTGSIPRFRIRWV